MKTFTLTDVESLAAQLRQEWGSAAIVPEVVNDHLAGLKLHVGPRHRADAFCIEFAYTGEADRFVSGGIGYSGALDSLRESLDRFMPPADANRPWYVATLAACVVVNAAGMDDARSRGATALRDLNPTGTIRVCRPATQDEIDLHGVGMGAEKIEA